MLQFEKIANEDNTLAEEILKVATEEVDELTDDQLLEDLADELEEAGFDLNDPEVIAGVEELINEGTVLDNATEKAAEFISEDIIKVSSGQTTGYETAAAARAMGNFFNMHGAANFGSAYGTAPVGTGSAISPGADSNVGGGFGRLMGQPGITANAVNATSKLSGVLRGNYSENIRTASDDAIENLIIEAANSEGQSVEDYLMDVGYQTLEQDILETLENQN
jgi:urease gamma subunit